MPGRLDYSRFDNLGASDSDEEAAAEPTPGGHASHEEVLAELPQGLSRELSLVLAARQGQDYLVEALLASRAEVNARDPHGGTALLRAVEAGGVSARAVIERLLASRADPAAGDDGGQTPLGRAASSGPAELLSAMLEAAVTVPSQEALSSALGEAGSAGNRATSRVLLAAGAPPGVGCLHGWAERGDLDLLQELLSRRADLNACSERDGATPLFCASRSSGDGSPAVVRWLCQQRAEPDIPAHDGRTPLALAAESEAGVGVVRALLECRASVQPTAEGKGNSPLVAAALAGRRAAAELLLDARACPNSADGRGRRPLPCGAAAGSTELCSLLLKARADPDGRSSGGDCRSGEGAGALSIAVATGHRGLVEQLLAAAADPEQPNERGLRPLMAAAAAGRAELCALLLDARANPSALTADDGKAALLLAAGAGCLPVCEVLLEARADVAQRSITGASALDAAAANGHSEVCRKLIGAGAAASAPGPGNREPAAAAAAAGHIVLADELRSAGTSAQSQVL
eukprot:TRINITY_DN97046_c0_g1_i1.p1 TRINITY_DN97046_c0_g1~~TRINITY_DN97046_c0_g1_i1.p1  ORF type:complete len:525 (+),score=126.99 TRINITY_DN97046_c0_g1_i1:23-1576(+)